MASQQRGWGMPGMPGTAAVSGHRRPPPAAHRICGTDARTFQPGRILPRVSVLSDCVIPPLGGIGRELCSLTAPVNWCYWWCRFIGWVSAMHVKFSEDVIPLSDLKINPGKVVGRAQDT